MHLLNSNECLHANNRTIALRADEWINSLLFVLVFKIILYGSDYYIIKYETCLYYELLNRTKKIKTNKLLAILHVHVSDAVLSPGIFLLLSDAKKLPNLQKSCDN